MRGFQGSARAIEDSDRWRVPQKIDGGSVKNMTLENTANRHQKE
jgi:hypothetical protein